MDLLGIDEFLARDAKYRRFKDEDYEDEGYIEENFGDEYANNMINGVISNIDQEFKKRRRRLPKERLK